MKRGRRPKPVVNMVTHQEFGSVAEAAAHAGVTKSKMYNHIHMVGARSINGEAYCYLSVKNWDWRSDK